MSRKRVLAISISAIGIAFIAAIIWVISTSNQLSNTKSELASAKIALSDTQTELANTESTLASAQTELANTKSTLASTQTELANTKNTLANTQTELTSTESTLASTQTELTNTKTELTSTESTLASTQTELTNTKTELTSTKSQFVSTQQGSSSLQSALSNTQQQLVSVQAKLGSANSTLAGLGITAYLGEIPVAEKPVDIVDNPNASNPTWNQLIQFLSTDTTYQNTYVEDVYDSTEFSRDIHNNAEKQGIKCAFVQLGLDNSDIRHDIVAFLTVDYGLVYISSTPTNSVCRINRGQTHRGVDYGTFDPLNLRNDSWWNSLQSGYYYLSPTSGSAEPIVTRIYIYW